MNYNSTADTLLHIKRVAKLLGDCSIDLQKRAAIHDDSKLQSPEKEAFDEFTPKLKNSTYGSDEYKENLKGLDKALKHHYANNPHHPEHHTDGINNMSLLDIIEMLMDWKAASERHVDGNIYNSIKINKERFNISEQLCDILTNTAVKLRW